MYAQFDLDIPDSLEAALGILTAENTAGAAPLAGGTNLLVDIRARRDRPARLVSLDRLADLKGIDNDGQRISVGSRTTVSDLLQSQDIARHAPSLLQAAKVFAGQMVRNTATIGGNIACGSPAADLVPPLLSLDAELELTSAAGVRRVALADYYQGYKSDVRAGGELITRIAWPCLGANCVNSFYKLARRKGDAITVTGVAVSLERDGNLCPRARIALGAVAPVVLRARAAEALLEGECLDAGRIAAAAQQAATECSPIDDIRASAGYRRLTVESLTRRLLTEAWQSLV